MVSPLHLCSLNMNVLPGPDTVTFQNPAFLNLQNANFLYDFLYKDMSVIPILYREQTCKCPNIKEEVHSRAVPSLKESVNLVDFNKQ